MKRHTCIICHQKRDEKNLIKVTHVGKNNVAYFGWVCDPKRYRRRYSKNYSTWGNGPTHFKDCKAEFDRREREHKDF